MCVCVRVCGCASWTRCSKCCYRGYVASRLLPTVAATAAAAAVIAVVVVMLTNVVP